MVNYSAKDLLVVFWAQKNHEKLPSCRHMEKEATFIHQLN